MIEHVEDMDAQEALNARERALIADRLELELLYPVPEWDPVLRLSMSQVNARRALLEAQLALEQRLPRNRQLSLEELEERVGHDRHANLRRLAAEAM